MHSTTFSTDSDIFGLIVDDAHEWDDPTFDAVYTRTNPVRAGADRLGIVLCECSDPTIHTLSQHKEHIMTGTTQYDSGTVDPEATTLAEQIAEVGLDQVATGITVQDGSSVVEDRKPWDGVDVLLDRFDNLVPSTWTERDHNEIISRASSRYFGQHNPRHITMIPIGPSTQADWMTDTVVFVYETDTTVRALLTCPTGDVRTYTRQDGSDGEVAIRRILKWAEWAERDAADEWVRDLRRALRDAQDDHLADFASVPDDSHLDGF